MYKAWGMRRARSGPNCQLGAPFLTVVGRPVPPPLLFCEQPAAGFLRPAVQRRFAFANTRHNTPCRLSQHHTNFAYPACRIVTSLLAVSKGLLRKHCKARPAAHLCWLIQSAQPSPTNQLPFARPHPASKAATSAGWAPAATPQLRPGTLDEALRGQSTGDATAAPISCRPYSSQVAAMSTQIVN